MERVLCFDPSGNYSDKEGKGHTGWALFEDGVLKIFGEVAAKNHETMEEYWASVASGIKGMVVNKVVCENYRLYAGARGKAQINSSLETPQLIGYLRMVCWENGIEFIEQPPNFKSRVTDEILVKMGVFEKKGRKHYCMGRPTNLHMRDAIRHGIFYHRFKKVN